MLKSGDDDDDSGGTCTDLITSYKLSDIFPSFGGSIGVGALLLGIFYILNTCLTLFWINNQKKSAESGVEGAARYVMFPLYMPFMWASAISDLLVGLIVLFISYDTYQSNSWPTTIAVSIMWSAQHFVIEGIACLLLQYGCGMQAVRKAIFGSSIWAFFTFLCYVYAIRHGGHAAIVITFVWHFSILVFYSVLWLAPDKFLFRRTALKKYSRFWALFRLLSIIGLVLVAFNEADMVADDAADCFYIIAIVVSYVIFKPYVVYYALLMDSIWWQGVYVPNPVAATISKSFYGSRSRKNRSADDRDRRQRSTGLGIFNTSNQNPKDMYTSSGDTDLVSPLHGIEVGFDEAQELAHRVDTLRAEGQVKLLNFAFLSLNKSQLLGVGSFSKVYRGKYRGTPVAIKLIFTVDLNPEIIHRVCKEAQLLSQINHPNVVEIFGVSVFPPSVCLVLEICHYGSLSDVIRGKGGSKAGSSVRPPLPLTHADKMYLALGCARGLEALHNYSETLCHRDVKSFNFLVDSQLNAKIADLELGGDDDEDPNYKSTADKHFVFGGAMRRSPASSNSNLSLGDDLESRFSNTSSGDNMVTQRTSFRSNRSNRSNRSGKSRGSRGSGLKRVSRKLFGFDDKDDEFLCTWQAPEVMISAPHTQASDIYSLGLVFWEIISGLVPFENTPIQDDIRTLVLSGKRPAMPPCADSRYVQLIKNCWKADWSARPDIKSIVSTLTLCWEASVHRYLFATTYVCNLQEFRRHYDNEVDRSSMSTGRFSSSGRGADDYLNRRSSLGKLPLSATAVKVAAYLQNEPRLQKLQQLTEIDKSAFIIVTPDSPNLVLWISKYVPKILGYFHNDLVCGDLACICGPSTNRFFFRTLMQEAGDGKSGHRLITFYRRDGSQFINSLHAFPIYAQDSPMPRDSGDSASTLRSSVTNHNPFMEEDFAPSSSTPSTPTSQLAASGYMDAINRSLAVAKQTTSEGRDYSPHTGKIRDERQNDGVCGNDEHENLLKEDTPEISLNSVDTTCDSETNLQHPETDTSDESPGNLNVQTSGELIVNSIIESLDKTGTSSSPMTTPERSRRQRKAQSLDLTDMYESPKDIPTKVAYVILHFNVVQDLRT